MAEDPSHNYVFAHTMNVQFVVFFVAHTDKKFPDIHIQYNMFKEVYQ